MCEECDREMSSAEENMVAFFKRQMVTYAKKYELEPVNVAKVLRTMSEDLLDSIEESNCFDSKEDTFILNAPREMTRGEIIEKISSILGSKPIRRAETEPVTNSDEIEAGFQDLLNNVNVEVKRGKQRTP